MLEIQQNFEYLEGSSTAVFFLQFFNICVHKSVSRAIQTTITDTYCDD